jgi:membrane protein DedA with SNARE-associated domain
MQTLIHFLLDAGAVVTALLVAAMLVGAFLTAFLEYTPGRRAEGHR